MINLFRRGGGGLVLVLALLVVNVHQCILQYLTKGWWNSFHVLSCIDRKYWSLGWNHTTLTSITMASRTDFVSEKAHGTSRMGGINEEVERRKAIGQFWQVKNTLGKHFVVKHFVSLRVNRATVYSILERFETGETVEKKSGSGQKPLKLPKASKNRLVKQACDCVGASRRSFSRKFNIGKSCVHCVLKKAGVKHYKRQKVPDTTPAQEQRQRTRLRENKEKLVTSDVIIMMDDELYFPSDVITVMDNELYFPFRHDGMPGNSGFNTVYKEKTPPEVKYKFRWRRSLCQEASCCVDCNLCEQSFCSSDSAKWTDGQWRIYRK